MAASGASAKKMQADLEQMQQNGGTALGRLATSADQHKQAWQASGVALLGFGAAAEAGVGLAVKAFADFSSKMAQVQSLSHASASEMQTLTDAALNMGQSIGFSATEVADAEIELVKAGISVKDIMGGALVGSLTLAAAGQIDVAQATEIATIAMTQFKLQGSDIPHVADLLAAGADKALGGVSELGWALKSGGLVAHQFGMSLDDTVGTLSLFAQNGLMGEAAGTDLRQMLLKLAAPSKTASEDMKKLGMSIYDQQGHFVGMTALAGQLHDKMGKLSESERNAMEAHIFGARSIVGANILYQAGASGVQDWINKVNDSGFAAKQAAGKMDSLNGDMNKLQAAWGTAMIEMGSTADGFLRPIVQNVTGVIHGFEGLSDSTKGTILGFTATSGAVALAVGGFLTLAPRVFDTIQGFKQLSADGSKIPGVLGGIGKAAGIAGLAFTGLQLVIQQFNSSQPKTDGVEAFTQAIVSLKSNSGSIDDIFKNIKFGQGDIYAGEINNVGQALSKLTTQDLTQAISSFGATNLGIDNGTAKIIDAVKKTDDSFASLASSGNFDLASAGFKKVADSAKSNGVGMDELQKRFPSYFDSLRKLANDQKVQVSNSDLVAWAMGKVPPAMQAAGVATQTYTDATGASVPVTKDQQKALDELGVSAEGVALDMGKLMDSFEKAGLIQIGADQALNDYHASLDAVDASIKKNGKSLDVTTEAGRANRKALDDVASASLKMLDANAKNGASQPELSKSLHGTYNDLLANYRAFGITGDKADTMARKVLGIPKGVKIDTAIQNYIDSMLKLQGISNAADNLNGKTANVYVNTHATTFEQTVGLPGTMADGSKGQGLGVYAPKKADGGAIHGPGTGTSDEIPAWLSNGEHVLTAAEVQKMGGQAAVYRFRDMVDKGQAPKFASGGAVFYNSPGHMHESAAAHANRLYREQQARAKELAKSYTYRYGELQKLGLEDGRGESYGTVNQSLSNGYQFSDRLRSAASSGNLPSQVGFLNATANHADATLRNLWAQSDRLGKSLTAAQARLTDLTNVKNSTASSLRGEFKLSDVISNTSMFGVPNITDVQGAATSKLHQIQAFGLKLNSLQKMGYSGAIVQEIAGMGSAQGTVAADALIHASKSQVTQLNGTYTAMDSASNAAGIYVTNSMFKGGVSVAQGIVKGLESQQSAIARAMTNVGLGMEKALKKALGINSPSRVATDITDNFTGTIIDRQKAALNPISAHATALGHAMVPSKSLFGGSGSTAYRPSAPTYQGAPNYRAANSGGVTVNHTYNITDQTNPIATAHEVTRRQTALKV
jgi:TP901 family phage tail tape measure protein